METAGDKTFLSITNKDIWDKLEALESKNTEEHSAILLHQKETNGKVKLNKWIASSALTIVLSVILTYIGIQKTGT